MLILNTFFSINASSQAELELENYIVLWQGNSVTEKTDSVYLIKGTIQNCTSDTGVFDRTCTTNVWFVSIDKNGKELSSKVLEEVK